MLKNERKINYMVGLAGKGNDQHRSWTGIQMNFWPLVGYLLRDRKLLSNDAAQLTGKGEDCNK